MQKASWDALEMIMEHLAQDYPELFSLKRKGDQWLWRNRALATKAAGNSHGRRSGSNLYQLMANRQSVKSG
ncbi:heme-dependent oxidative N-demethylase subunit alpha family protein, partial [Paraburkholderia sp. SIMBA_027]|uniref:heme-dependent oxidative N-demethylase subunit alpha family protein n=1 Tax=Paraburkholderia sp. SIMBA_027 TaxID=3085770 RepID=UPI00397BB835